MEKYFTVLKKCPLFKNMAENEIKNYIECVKTNVIKVKKDTDIYSVGDYVNKIGIIIKGSVIIYKEDIDGNRNIIARKYESSIFGETFVFGEKYYSPVSVLAFSDVEILFIRFENIYTRCEKNCNFHNAIIQNMLSVIANNNILLNDKIEILSAKTTRDKIIIFLEQMQNRAKSKTFNIEYNREQLADFLSLNRSSMSRELSKMQDEKLIKYRKNKFEMLV